MAKADIPFWWWDSYHRRLSPAQVCQRSVDEFLQHALQHVFALLPTQRVGCQPTGHSVERLSDN